MPLRNIELSTNDSADVFIYDLQTAFLYKASINNQGEAGDSHSWSPALAQGGFMIAFQSEATNLVVGDTNSRTDIFVHQWQLYTTYLPITAHP